MQRLLNLEVSLFVYFSMPVVLLPLVSHSVTFRAPDLMRRKYGENVGSLASYYAV